MKTKCIFNKWCSQKDCDKVVTQAELDAAQKGNYFIPLFVAPPIPCIEKGYLGDINDKS